MVKSKHISIEISDFNEMKETVAILFCGGEGKRMRPLTYYMQKVMMPIGKDQLPILEYVIKHLKKHGVSDIILLVNYKKEQIQGYFGTGEKWGVNLTYIPDKPGPVGTGTALLNARKEIGNRRMIIYYSDIITNINFAEMINYHKKHNKWATIYVSEGWKIRVGTAEIDDENNVTRFIEKPVLPLLVNTGISIVEPIIFNFLDNLNKSESIDLSKDIFPIFVRESQIVAYKPPNIYWEDIGSLERYEKLDGDFITDKMNDLSS